jgi:Trypsin-co-occurring domain 2
VTGNTTPKMRLADAIAELRAEISRARQEGEGKDVRFAAKEIEVELSLDFGWKAEASVGVSKWIPFVDLGVKGSGDEKSLHNVKSSRRGCGNRGAGRRVSCSSGLDTSTDNKPRARSASIIS